MYRWVADPENRMFSAGGSGLTWSVVRRRTAYDMFVADSASSVMPDYFTAGVFGTTHTMPQSPEHYDVPRLRAGRRKKALSLLQELTISRDSLLFLAIDNTILFFSAPDESGEKRRKEGRRRKQKYLATGAATDFNTAIISPWDVWAITPSEILNEIQYHMLEPVIDGGLTWQFWDATEVQNYVAERVGRWLMETSLVRSRTTLNLSAGERNYLLDSTAATLQRVYKQGQGVMSRLDRWSLDHSQPDWESQAAGTPTTFIQTQGANGETIKVVPTPSGTGTLSYVYVSTTPTTGTGDFVFRPMRVPATFAWAIKYGVMADMLSREGEGNDPIRAAYCEQRFKDGVQLAKMFMGSRGAK